MYRPKLALLAVSFCLTGLLLGCGGSSNNPPPSPLQVTTQTTLPSGRVNTPYTTTLAAAGGVAPYTWSGSNEPPGLVLSSVGVLTGTPTVVGAFVVNVAVTDSAKSPGMATSTFSITIAAPLQITTTSLPSGSPGVFYSTTLAATGGFLPYTWTIAQGSLPSGLTLSATSGMISGTPTGTGMSSITVQASDSGTPTDTTTAARSIVINTPPSRSAALYTAFGAPFATHRVGLQIQSDGSLLPLPSSPESAITGSVFAPSPTLPLLFMYVPSSGTLESLLVNSDYSLVTYSTSSPLPGGTQLTEQPSVDPTGSNLYLAGYIDSNLDPGVTVFPANGSLQALGTIAVPDVTNLPTRMVFTPDGTMAFLSTCSQSSQGNIRSFSRASNGMLTATATYSGLACSVAGAMAVSPDGRYLATNEVQIYSIASNGALTSVLSQPFTVTGGGVNLTVNDITWDSSGSFLLAGTWAGYNPFVGGVAVLGFSGSALTETVPPSGGAVMRLQQTGSFVYGMTQCDGGHCSGSQAIVGYDSRNGLLTALPGSPYLYGNGGDMVVY